MMRRKVVLITQVGTDNPIAKYGVIATNDFQAVQMIAEHHLEIKENDFEVLTLDGLDVAKGNTVFDSLFRK